MTTAAAALLAVSIPVYLSAASPPALMFWAWERPGDLRELPKSAGAAFLAVSIHLRDGGVRAVPRFQPLQLPPGAFRMAVIRIDASSPALSAAQRKDAIDIIVDAVRTTRPDALQVDFDARVSERPFYAALLRELRAKLPPGLYLSITALVSWCGPNSWLDRLPVDEVVPMTFEMGAATAATETLLRTGGSFQNPACRGSIGVSLRDLPLRPQNFRRTYVFAYEDWTGPLTRSVLSRFR
jgi:hypothetical protein